LITFQDMRLEADAAAANQGECKVWKGEELFLGTGSLFLFGAHPPKATCQKKIEKVPLWRPRRGIAMWNNACASVKHPLASSRWSWDDPIPAIGRRTVPCVAMVDITMGWWEMIKRLYIATGKRHLLQANHSNDRHKIHSLLRLLIRQDIRECMQDPLTLTPRTLIVGPYRPEKCYPPDGSKKRP
jgi:hypothetical protein